MPRTSLDEVKKDKKVKFIQKNILSFQLYVPTRHQSEIENIRLNPVASAWRGEI